jgi:16S rRNA G966 N2-methylase RsmD
MTKTRKGMFKPLPMLGKMKEGLHLIGEKGSEIVCVVRKVKFNEKNKKVDGCDKYFNQRYSLFKKFDQGIQLDKESWFSVTHEVIAKHIAKICRKCKIVLDGFAGVGGNVIAFAKHSKVIAVDIDQKKLEMLDNNAEIYEVRPNVTLVHSDFLKFETSEKIDVVFASPPWGGPDYINSEKFNFCDIFPSFSKILKKSSSLSKNLIFYLPKNLDPCDLYEELLSSEVPISKIELQIYYINSKIKGIGCFCGDLVHPNESQVTYLKSLPSP